MLIFEKSEIIYTSGDFSYSDTRTGNLYIVKLNPQKELDWVEVVAKNQQEPSNPVFTGFISMPDGKDGLYIFYHDDARNEKLESGEAPRITPRCNLCSLPYILEKMACFDSK